MSNDPDIETAVQRELLQVALRNSARSVGLLMAAVLFIAWLGWEHRQPAATLATLLLGSAVAGWRWLMQRRQRHIEALDSAQIRRVVTELEANAVLVGGMWIVATLAIYPALNGVTATVYVVMVCGSVATAAFFLSVAGRSFLWLTTLQLGSLIVVSLLDDSARSVPLAVLAAIFGVTMVRSAHEFRDTTRRALHHGLQADAANA